MARDRQRAKHRQAERRAERLAQRRAARERDLDPRASAPGDGMPEDELAEIDPEELADLEVGAPPQDVGRSDTVVEHPPDPFDTDVDDLELGDDGGATNGGAVAGPVGRRGGAAAARPHRSRLVAFLIAVWAELGRVQWPDRRQLIQLTGVVLFFVIIVGAYLGALDAIFSKLINLIL